uniref:Uncharacterized protein n=1 Tax=viral metagenome TaxID=1070528 RepID=A0A6M3LYU4_9ZZZZ
MTEIDLLSDLLVDVNRYMKLISKYNADECTTSEKAEIIPFATQIMLKMIGINTRVSRENEKRLDALEKRIEALKAEG